MNQDWAELQKGGHALILQREDVREMLPGHAQKEELLVVYSLDGEKRGRGIQCPRALLVDLLHSLAPSEVRIFRPDEQLRAAVNEAALRDKAGMAVH